LGGAAGQGAAHERRDGAGSRLLHIARRRQDSGVRALADGFEQQV